MKKMSEVAPRLLVVQIQIQAVWSEWTNTQKVDFTDTNSALKAKSSKKTLQDLKISLSLGLESPSKIFNRRGLGSRMTYFLFKTLSWWKPEILNMLKRWLLN